MFKLPVCPHCKATYYYKDVKKSAKNKNDSCHHCKKNFAVRKTAGFMVLGLLTFFIAIMLNVIFLYIMPSFNFLLLFTGTVAIILIGYLFYPFFVAFKAENNKEKMSKK